MSEILVDTSFVYALYSTKDQKHARLFPVSYCRKLRFCFSAPVEPLL
jgi:hypothetical protein